MYSHANQIFQIWEIVKIKICQWIDVPYFKMSNFNTCVWTSFVVVVVCLFAVRRQDEERQARERIDWELLQKKQGEIIS